MSRDDRKPEDQKGRNDLMIDRATGDVEIRDLEDIAGEALEFDLLAGEIAATLLESEDVTEEMPKDLARKLGGQGRSFFSSSQQSTESDSTVETTGSELGRQVIPIHSEPRESLAKPRPKTPSPLSWSGWVAAAALAALWISGLGERPPAEPPLPAEMTAEQRFDALGAEGIRLGWAATEDPAASGASGEVVWSGASQAGMMRFAGLAANDPTISQYQLWIFDGTRDDRYPVDGGVFDIPPGEIEVLVPIEAKIDVRDPVLFAVTVEQPGGVVVSDRERIVMAAQLEE